MRISDRSSDVCSSDLYEYYEFPAAHCVRPHRGVRDLRWKYIHFYRDPEEEELYDLANDPREMRNLAADPAHAAQLQRLRARLRSEEHTSELQSLMRIPYAVFCLQKKNKTHRTPEQ